MAIAGAIFDCDGTLVDSMPMWREVFVGLLREWGVDDADAVFDEFEHLNMEDKCHEFHAHHGVGESEEALLAEVVRRVEEAYRTRVPAIDGACDFVRELAQAGIPMVIASATARPQLMVALEAQGIAGLFEEIVTGADVAFGKDHPDIYYAALDLLGTPKGETWVFEDAPFGVRTAHLAGFPTVAVVNDHDGRDVGFLRQHADIVAHGYGGLSVGSLRDFAPASSRGELRVLVVDGSPEPSSGELVRGLVQAADYVIAVDRGADVLLSLGITPDAFCGDADSVSPEAAAWAESAAALAEDLPAEKYDTDLGVALVLARSVAASRGLAPRVSVTCAAGGRPDHALAVVGLLGRNADMLPREVEDGFELRVLGEATSWELGEGLEGATFSAIPLEPGTVVSESSMRWELDHVELGLLADRGVSNVAYPGAAITCHAGVVAAYLIR